MKKAWKGYANVMGDLVGPEVSEYMYRPVLVIDASDFPADTPEIGSEWVDDEGDHHTVESAPAYVCGEWVTLTTCTDAEGTEFPYYARIDSLKPIPETAKGEVVGTVRVETDEAGNVTLRLVDAAVMANGTFDIIKRGDK